MGHSEGAGGSAYGHCEELFVQRRFAEAGEACIRALRSDGGAGPQESGAATASVSGFRVALSTQCAPADLHAGILLQSAYEARRWEMVEEFLAFYSEKGREMPLPIAVLWLKFAHATRRGAEQLRATASALKLLRATPREDALEAPRRDLLHFLLLEMLWNLPRKSWKAVGVAAADRPCEAAAAALAAASVDAAEGDLALIERWAGAAPLCLLAEQALPGGTASLLLEDLTAAAAQAQADASGAADAAEGAPAAPAPAPAAGKAPGAPEGDGAWAEGEWAAGD